MNATVPNSFTFKVTKKIRIPVTVPFVLNGTPKVVGTYQGKPVYGYKTELVDETVVVYAEKLENAVAMLKDKFGTDFVYTIL